MRRIRTGDVILGHERGSPKRLEQRFLANSMWFG